MAVEELPLSPSEGLYRFGTVLNDVSYIVDVRWNSRDSAWYMDWYSEALDVVCLGIKIVLGMYLGRRCDLSPFRDGVFMAVDTSGEEREAGFDDLGTRVVVRYIRTEDLLILLDQARRTVAGITSPIINT